MLVYGRWSGGAGGSHFSCVLFSEDRSGLMIHPGVALTRDQNGAKWRSQANGGQILYGSIDEVGPD